MTTEARHKKDRIRQAITPTVMVPRETPLEPCRMGYTRFLMASDGLYIDARTRWASFTRNLWRSDKPVPLPYGDVTEHDGLGKVMTAHVLPIMNRTMLAEAAQYAERSMEWAGFVLWDGSGFVPHTTDIRASHDAVGFSEKISMDIPEGHEIVADIHSHHRMPPIFSNDDDDSDLARIKIAIVLGNYRHEGGKPRFDLVARNCIQGFFFDPQPEHEHGKPQQEGNQ
jgi:PRTRC genetic system protein A